MISVVLPCYNEELAIPEMVAGLRDLVKALDAKGCTAEVIIVDDGSSDRSAEMLQSSGFKVIHHAASQGYGAALRSGFSHCAGDWIVFLDMDRTYRPADILRLVEHASKTNADMVFGYRLFWSSGMPAIRALGNQFFAALVNVLFSGKMQDVCTGLRVFHRRRMADVSALTRNGLNFSVQLTVFSLLNEWIIEQVEIRYDSRLGVSKLNWVRDGFQFLWVIIKLRFVRRGISYPSSAL
jgi:glycosyltransferase involved in cell wall biosynthesis